MTFISEEQRCYFLTLALVVTITLFSFVAAIAKQKSHILYKVYFFLALLLLSGSIGCIIGLDVIWIILGDLCLEVQYTRGVFALFQSGLQTQVDAFFVQQASAIQQATSDACQLINSEVLLPCCTSLATNGNCSVSTFPGTFVNSLLYDIGSASTYQLQLCAFNCVAPQVKNFSLYIYNYAYAINQLTDLGNLVNSTVITVAGANFRNSGYEYFCFNTPQIIMIFGGAGTFVIALIMVTIVIMWVHPKRDPRDDSDLDRI